MFRFYVALVSEVPAGNICCCDLNHSLCIVQMKNFTPESLARTFLYGAPIQIRLDLNRSEITGQLVPEYLNVEQIHGRTNCVHSRTFGIPDWL